jgi:hypothetical protein
MALSGKFMGVDITLKNMLKLVAYINTSERPSRWEQTSPWYFRGFLNTSVQVGFRVFPIYML